MDPYLKNTFRINEQLSLSGLKSFNLASLKKRGVPDAVIVIGMGGSGLSGDILRGLAGQIGLKIPIFSWKSYGLGPDRHNFKKPLYIFVSFSGNTEETLSGLMWLLEKDKKAAIATVASGGELKKIALINNLPFVTYAAKDLTPRQAIGYNYYALSKVLLVYFPSINVPDLRKKVNPSSLKSLAIKIARKLKGRIPLIYTDDYNGHWGYAWKTILNETAKIPAFANFLPEADHNEITSFENKKFPLTTLFLIDRAAQQKISSKIKNTQKVLKSRLPINEVSIKGNDAFQKNWNSIILAHLTAYYLSKIYKINPTETKLINQLKNLK